jgi:hypothetical protein
MLLTPHTIVGVAVGASVANPYIAVPISIFLHFMGDAVPHWDFFSNTTKEERLKGWRPIAVMADLVLAVGIGLTVTLYALWVLKEPALALNIFLCGIAAVLPDALEAPYIYMQKNTGFLKLLTGLQSRMQFQAPLPWGIITQLIVIMISSLVILSSLTL